MQALVLRRMAKHNQYGICSENYRSHLLRTALSCLELGIMKDTITMLHIMLGMICPKYTQAKQTYGSLSTTAKYISSIFHQSIPMKKEVSSTISYNKI